MQHTGRRKRINMRLRTVLLSTALGSAVAVPYYLGGPSETASSLSSLWGSASPPTAAGDGGSFQGGSELALGGAGIPSSLEGDPTSRPAAKVPLEGMPVYDLADVLRMDVTQSWVYSRWSRKSTALADLDLHGIRVPLVTGTEVDDLAGSLTYYFNAAGQVQRLSFRGRTGDTRKLVTLVVARFGFRRQPPRFPSEQLYQVRWNGKPISELRIRPAPIIWAHAPHASFEVTLELERPGSGRFLQLPEPPAVARANPG